MLFIVAKIRETPLGRRSSRNPRYTIHVSILYLFVGMKCDRGNDCKGQKEKAHLILDLKSVFPSGISPVGLQKNTCGLAQAQRHFREISVW